MRCLLNEDTIRNAKPKSKQSFLWDEQIRGFGIRISSKGRKSYVVQERGPDRKSQRKTLAACDELPLANAREQAVAALAAIRKGEKGDFLETTYRLEIVLPNPKWAVDILNHVLSHYQTNDLSFSLKPKVGEDICVICQQSGKECDCWTCVACGGLRERDEHRWQCDECHRIIGVCCLSTPGELICEDCAGGMGPQ